jgi:GNAT superfamily N-acetyltransferase
MEQKSNRSPVIEAIEINLQASYEHLGRALEGTFHQQTDLCYFFTGRPVFLCNGVIRFQCRATEAEERIEALCGEASRRRVPLTWLLGPSSAPADLEQRLLARGCREDEQVPGMAIDLAGCETLQVSAPAGLEIKEVADAATMERWLTVLYNGFGFPEPIRAVFSGLYRRYGFLPQQSVRYLLGTLDGVAVGTALLNFEGGVPGLYGIATLPHLRRQGIGAAMTLAAMRAARAAGYQIATLQATPMGFNVYRRLGWQEYCLFKTLIYQPVADEPPSASAS